MVLHHKLNSAIERKMNEAIRIRVEAIPLNQQVISCHCEGQASFEVLPDTMQYLLEMTYGGQHR